jgi:hypothetical protein
MLLCNVMAESLLALRARQARLDAVLAKVRTPARAEARQAEADTAAATLAAVRAEARRLRVKEPRADQGGAAVYGHVLQDGEPVVGAEVALLDGDEQLAVTETDRRGAFALSATSERPLALQVSVGGRLAYRDDEATILASKTALYRFVELAGTDRPPDEKPSDEPSDEPGDGPPRPDGRPSHIPGTLIEVLRRLQDSGQEVVAVHLSDGGLATPVVTSVNRADAGVELEVEGRVTDAGVMEVVAALLAHEPEAEVVGITSATDAASRLRHEGVDSREEVVRVSELPPEEVAHRFRIKPEQAAALKVALARVMSKLFVRE